MNDSIKLENLSAEQVEMLNFMWYELETEKDYLQWYECLDSEQQHQADVLQRLIIMEVAEQFMGSDMYPEAKELLSQFTLNKGH